MKYTCEVIIKLPIAKVIELFINPDNLGKWQEGFISSDLKEGEAGKTGAKTALKYNMNNSDIEMTETILVNDLPDEYSALYESTGVKNWFYNYFEEKGADQTLWKTSSIFKFSGLMAFFSIFLKKAFVKQTYNDMTSFKNFAENLMDQQNH